MSQEPINEYQKRMCRFGNRGGGHRGPKFKHVVTVSLDEADYQHLVRMKPFEGSLAEEVRRCIAQCREGQQS